jgi:SAM-dependent methyltransferase
VPADVTPLQIPEALARAAKDLPKLYDDPLHYELLAQMTAPADVPFYRALYEEHGGPVLELGCGTGRVALELVKDGAELVGVDLSPAMLDYMGQKAQAEGLEVTIALGDLRKFDLGRTFPLVLVTYNTFNHLLDLDSLTSALASIAKHMDAGSRLVIDTFQPSLSFLGGEPEKSRGILRYLDPYIEKETVIFEENHYDPATQKNHVVWSYEVAGTPGARHEDFWMRLYFPAELDALLTLSGFTIEAKYGDYDRRPFDAKSGKQLYVLRRPG